jgi:hypothetical protein
VAPEVLKHPAGSEVTAEVQCPRLSAFTAIDETKKYDAPEYILGPGPPQFARARYEQGQAYQLGYIFDGDTWFANCDPICVAQRRRGDFNRVFADEVGRPGPVLAALVYARTTSIASQIK